ncbi:MAG: GAF domain-containing protein [Candidatus Brocadia sp.]|nr:GAF domain-containing protein [Candidatus Brocadia sp.]
MTTATLNTTVLEDIRTVQDTLHDIKCLTKLYQLLQNARDAGRLRNNFYETAEELNLREIGHALISVLDLDRLFPLVNHLTVNRTNSLSGMIAFVTAEEVHVKASTGLPNLTVKNKIFKNGKDPIGWIVKNDETVVANDYAKDCRFEKQQAWWLSGNTFLCVPMKVQGRVIGVISVTNKRSGEFYTDGDIQFLEMIADYTAIAIKDSDLYSRLKNFKKVDQLTTTYHDKDSKYLPVTLKSIKTGAFTECDLYLQTVVNQEINYLLYCKGNKLFDDERKESFVKKNINKIFVAKNGNAQYLRYMEANLDEILNDELTTRQEKIEIIYNIATNMLTDTIKSSNIFVVIERGKELISVILDLISKDRGIHSSLIKVLKYNGNISNHSVNVAVMGLLFGQYLGISASNLLSLGSGLLFHDIGKIRIDSHTQKKEYGDLTKVEKETLRKHPDMGFVLLSNTGNLAREASLVSKQHHEQYDGKGYPDGLKGEEIHCYSRIARILDEYEVELSKISEKDTNPAFRVFQRMVNEKDGNYDKELLKKFIKFMHMNSFEESIEVLHKDNAEVAVVS